MVENISPHIILRLLSLLDVVRSCYDLISKEGLSEVIAIFKRRRVDGSTHASEGDVQVSGI